MRVMRNRLKSQIATSLNIDGNSIKVSRTESGKMKVWFTDKTSRQLGLEENQAFVGYATELPTDIARAIYRAHRV